MDATMLYKLIQKKMNRGHSITIAVEGTSMLPLLKERDEITVRKAPTYVPGDVLAFIYKEGHLLAHRLLFIQKNYFYCKGDNSFRLENVSYECILGKVTHVNQLPIKPCTQQLLELSYMVNREFFRCRYNVEKTQKSKIYARYLKERQRSNENV